MPLGQPVDNSSIGVLMENGITRRDSTAPLLFNEEDDSELKTMPS
jgi:hypothetical protein